MVQGGKIPDVQGDATLFCTLFKNLTVKSRHSGKIVEIVVGGIYVFLFVVVVARYYTPGWRDDEVRIEWREEPCRAGISSEREKKRRAICKEVWQE